MLPCLLLLPFAALSHSGAAGVCPQASELTGICGGAKRASAGNCLVCMQSNFKRQCSAAEADGYCSGLVPGQKSVAINLVPALHFELLPPSGTCATSYPVVHATGLYLLSLDDSENAGSDLLTFYEYSPPIDPSSEWKHPNAVNKARHRLQWKVSGAEWSLGLEVLQHPLNWALVAQTTFNSDATASASTCVHSSSCGYEALRNMINSLATSGCLGAGGITACEWTLHMPTASAPSPCATPVQSSSVTIAAADAFQELHRVTALPGWNHPLPSRLFAGSVPVVDTGFQRRFIHYMLAEAEDQGTTPPLFGDEDVAE